MNTISRFQTVLIASAALVGLGCADGAHPDIAFDLSRTGEQIVFTSADEDLYLLDLKTSQVRQLTQTEALERTPSFSPDSRQIVYAAQEKGASASFLFTRSIDGKQLRQLTNAEGVCDWSPSFSPDGSRIVFARAHRYRPYSMGGWTWDDWDVYVMKSDGTELKRVTDEKYRGASSPKFLADGKTLIFSAEAERYPGNTTRVVFEVQATGDRPPKLLTADYPKERKTAAWGSDPSVSADGASIAFISDRENPFGYDVCIMNRDGTKPRPLGITNVSHYNQFPRFLPDGKSVMFLAGWRGDSFRPADFALWQVDSDGKNVRQVADYSLFTTPLKWKPKR
jgi:Tol biopolymer transport system component